MSDVILVALGEPETAPALLRAAECLAGLLGGAHVAGLASGMPRHVGLLAAEVLIAEADADQRVAHEEASRIASLRAAFEHWAAEANVPALTVRWIEGEGDAGGAVGEHGSRADFVVVAQPAKDDRLAWQVFRSALFATARPVLMVPKGLTAPFGRRVAIAWRDDKQAARAVIPALRCLGAAEHVDVLMGVREDAGRPAMPRMFVDHGIAATPHDLPMSPGPFGRTLLDRVHEIGADLLVMGAYAHSPLRELILGGVTRYVLAHADLPVLMRH